MANKEAVKGTRPRIDTDKFVKVWVDTANKKGGTVADVAEAIGCSLPGAINKYKRLKEDGAELPELPTGSGRSRVNVEEINAYVEKNLKAK